MSHPWIADRTRHFDSSGIRKVFDLAAKMKDPINLSIGQPDFDVPEAVQRLVARGRGAVVVELRDVLVWIRSGMGEAAGFRHAAEGTPEPSAARTYRLLAAGVERGVDLASGLLALSEDIRDSRREQIHKEAVRRRAAMLLPTIGILAPIMLLFIAAPLPSIVLGQR